MRLSLPISILSLAAVVAPLALVSAPAHAGRASDDYRCTTLAQQAQAALTASTADASAVDRARRAAANGRALCNAGNAADAGRQYRIALRTLGVEEARTDDQQAVAQR